MGMDPVTVGMMVTAAIAAIGSAMSVTAAGYAEDAEIKAAVQEEQLVDTEVNRQQLETGRAAEREKSARIAQADRELATLRVISGERGALAQTATSLAGQIGFYEGLDLSTIDANRDAQIEAGQAAKRAGSMDAANAVLAASSRKQAAVLGAGLDFVGTGLQIAGNYTSSTAGRSAAQNKKG